MLQQRWAKDQPIRWNRHTPAWQMRVLLTLVFFSAIAAQYVPEPYGWACFRMAAKRDWPTCASAHRTKQRECLCQIPEFVVLTESCLNDAVANVTTDQDSVKAFARHESLCMVPSTARDDAFSHWQSTSKNPHIDVPEMEYVEPINAEDIEIALRTAEWRMTNDRRATRAGAILIAFWVFVLLVRYLALLVKLVTPDSWLHALMTRRLVKRLQAKFLNSPLVHQRHCQPCLGFLGIRVPTRVFSVLIIIFAAANYALIFTDYPYEPSNFIYPSRTQQYNKSLAIRAAFMIMWKLPLLVCFSGRNNIFLLAKHPWPLDTFNVLHKWIGRITVVDIIIHSVAISLVKAEQGFYGIVWKVDYWRWGVAGTIITSIIAVQSMHWVSKRNYDAFVAVHVVLGVLFLVSAWYHVYTLPYGKYHVLATCAIWGFDRALRITRILMAGKVEANVRHHDTSVTVLTIKAPRLYYHQKIHSSNSYVYLHVPSWYLFWQSHPFTIVKKGFRDSAAIKHESLDSVTILQQSCGRTMTQETAVSKTSDRTQACDESQETDLMICIRHRRGITKYISRLPEGPLKVALDGPYGYSHPLHRFSRVVLFAGGIGITPVLSYVKRALELRPGDIQIQIHWAVTELASMRWAFEELTAASKDAAITVYVSGKEQGSDMVLDYTRCATFIFQRLTCIDVVKSEVALTNAAEYELSHLGGASSLTEAGAPYVDSPSNRKKEHQSLAIFSCGPDKLNDDARVAACWAIENAKVYVDYYEESFSW